MFLCSVPISSEAASPVLSDNAFLSGDVNADGEITSTDYILVKKAFAILFFSYVRGSTSCS